MRLYPLGRSTQMAADVAPASGDEGESVSGRKLGAGAAPDGAQRQADTRADTSGRNGGGDDLGGGRREAGMFADLVTRASASLPGPSDTAGPFVGPDRARRMVPFQIALLLCFATVLLPPDVEMRKVAIAAGISVALVASMWLVPWRRLPVWSQAMPVFCFYAVVALMRDASGGAASALTPMALLPPAWLALYHGWGLVVAGLIATETVMLAPLLLVGPPDYPAGGWRRAMVIGVVATAIAVSMRMLVVRAEANARQIAEAGILAHRQHEFAEAVLDSANTLIMVVDLEGRVVAFNSACEVVSGYRADEVRGKRAWHMLAAREDRPALARLFAERQRAQAQTPPGWEQHTESHEVEWVCRTGQRRRVRWSDSAIRDEQGRLAYLVATGVDVTDQRNTEELLRHLLAAATEQSMIGTDLSGVVTVFNAGAERMLGYRAGEVVGRRTPDLFHDREEIAALAAELGVEPGFDVFAALVRRNLNTRRWSYLRHDGGRVPVELTVSLIRNGSGDPIGYLGVARDITAEQAAQDALRTAYERERASAERLRELDHARTEFIAAASHDLRTPLTSVMAYHELLLDPSISTLSDEDREMLTAAHRNARRLLALISDLLVISKIDAGNFTVDLRPVSLDDAIRGALDAVVPGIGQRDLDIQVSLPDQPPVVAADKGHLERALMNLIGNAVKFTPDGGQISISVTDERKVEDRGRGEYQVDGGEHVTIRVTDTGCGIPAHELPDVFQRFFRSTRTRGTVSGTGLGLAITKAIIDAHQGGITIDSEPGHGTTVTVTLPGRPTSGDGCGSRNLA